MTSQKYDLLQKLYRKGDIIALNISHEDIRDTSLFCCSEVSETKWDGKITENLAFAPSCSSGSDYSGGALSLSNFKVCQEAWKGKDWHKEFSGWYGTFGIMIHAASFLQDHATEGDEIELLEGLGNYPVLDESHLSELETEWEEEAWKDWVASDFEKEVRRAFPEILTDEIIIEPDDLWQCFCVGFKASNAEWISEDIASGSYVDIKRVVSGLTIRDVLQMIS